MHEKKSIQFNCKRRNNQLKVNTVQVRNRSSLLPLLCGYCCTWCEPRISLGNKSDPCKYCPERKTTKTKTQQKHSCLQVSFVTAFKTAGETPSPSKGCLFKAKSKSLHPKSCSSLSRESKSPLPIISLNSIGKIRIFILLQFHVT